MSVKPGDFVGLWDLQESPLFLGGLLVFAEELLALSRKEKPGDVWVGFFPETEQWHVKDSKKNEPYVLCSPSNMSGQNAQLVNLVGHIEGLKGCFLMTSNKNVKDVYQSHSGRVWPPEKGNFANDQRYVYGTTKVLQDIWKKDRFLPALNLDETSLRKARGIIRKNVFPSIPIAVHLKNRPSEQSNANMAEWGQFFKKCIGRHDVKFVLVGNDSVSDNIVSLPNVIRPSSQETSLLTDMALIQTSFAFMGMASGPCQMALFNRQPYVIFKNPHHHKEEMIQELGDRDHYPFSSPLQKLFRKAETVDLLLSELKTIMNDDVIHEWKNGPARMMDKKL